MPRAIRGEISNINGPKAYTKFSFCLGVLIECDPSIKSIIVQIDAEDHAYIVEELDDQTLVVKENMLTSLKLKLDEVGDFLISHVLWLG